MFFEVSILEESFVRCAENELTGFELDLAILGSNDDNVLCVGLRAVAKFLVESDVDKKGEDLGCIGDLEIEIDKSVGLISFGVDDSNTNCVGLSEVGTLEDCSV